MKSTTIFSLFSLVCAGLCAVTGARAADGKPTLFVAPLDGDTSQIMAWQPALGEGLAEMLITEVTRIGKFEVLESTALKDLAGEIDLGESGYVASDEKVQKGGWAGADFMLRGKVTRFGSKEQGVGLGGVVPGSLGKLGVKVATSDVRIDWRLVDVFNRKIVKSGSATASQKGAGFDLGVAVDGRGGNIGFSNKEFMNSALGKAAAKAVTNVIDEVARASLPESGRNRNRSETAARQQAQQQAAATQQQAEAQAASSALKATPGKVLAVVDKTTVIVSLGSKHGFKAGDTLNVFENIDTKDDKGEVVFSEEKLAGTVTLQSVQEERSKASYAGTSDPKSGWTVKAK